MSVTSQCRRRAYEEGSQSDASSIWIGKRLNATLRQAHPVRLQVDLGRSLRSIGTGGEPFEGAGRAGEPVRSEPGHQDRIQSAGGKTNGLHHADGVAVHDELAATEQRGLEHVGHAACRDLGDGGVEFVDLDRDQLTGFARQRAELLRARRGIHTRGLVAGHVRAAAYKRNGCRDGDLGLPVAVDSVQPESGSTRHHSSSPRASQNDEKGNVKEMGYVGDVFACGPVAFPKQHHERAESLSWSDIGIGHTVAPYAYSGGHYSPIAAHPGAERRVRREQESAKGHRSGYSGVRRMRILARRVDRTLESQWTPMPSRRCCSGVCNCWRPTSARHSACRCSHMRLTMPRRCSTSRVFRARTRLRSCN